MIKKLCLIVIIFMLCGSNLIVTPTILKAIANTNYTDPNQYPVVNRFDIADTLIDSKNNQQLVMFGGLKGYGEDEMILTTYFFTNQQYGHLKDRYITIEYYKEGSNGLELVKKNQQDSSYFQNRGFEEHFQRKTYEDQDYIYVRVGIAAQENASVYTDEVLFKVEKIIYKADDMKILPKMKLEGNVTSWTNQDVIITATATTSGSPIKKITLPDGEEITGSIATYSISRNGTYIFYVEDEEGNRNWNFVSVSKIDKDPPIVKGVEDNAVYNGSVRIEFETSNGVKATLNGEPFTSGETVRNDGTYTLVVRDLAGNETRIVFTIKFVPIVVEGIFNNGSYNKDVVITFNRGEATLNGKPFINGSTVSEEGDYTFRVTEYYPSGSSYGRSVQFQIDKTAPVVSGVEDGKNYTEPVTITFNEGNALLDNDEPFTSGTTLSEEGRYTLVVYDKAKNETKRTFTIDNTEPEGYVYGNSGPWTNQNVILRIDAYDKGSGLKHIKLPDGSYVKGSEVIYEVEKNGEYVFELEDYAGYKRVLVIPVENIDKTPPPRPTIYTVADNQSVVKGKAEPNSHVFVEIGTQLYKQYADTKGDYAITIPAQKAGTTINVYAKDYVGNRSTIATTKVIDKTPPVKPTIYSVADNQKVIKGKTEASATVYVQIGTKIYKGITNTKGEYSITIPIQKAGTSLNVYAEDSFKNRSATATIKVIDKTPPPKPTIYTVANNQKVVKGKTEAGATVYVQLEKWAGIYKGTANTKGEYSIAIPTPKAGTIISVYAEDKSKNKSVTVTTKVIDKIPPTKPTINKVTTKTTVISGKTEGYATVYIKIGSKTHKLTANSKGDYSLKISRQKKGTTISVYAVDKAGNKSSSMSTTVK